jgi:hypothetical protein
MCFIRILANELPTTMSIAAALARLHPKTCSDLDEGMLTGAGVATALAQIVLLGLLGDRTDAAWWKIQGLGLWVVG